MLITATWKVTHNGIVLLDTTDYMATEPRVERAFVVDRFPSLGSAGIHNYGRLNVSHNATFTQVRAFRADADARAYMRTQTASISNAPNDCLIEWINLGVSSTLQNCVIANYRGYCENNRFYADYALQGGDMLATGFTPPTPPPVGTAGWRFVTVTGPPAGVSLQVQNSSGVWETVYTYIASS